MRTDINLLPRKTWLERFFIPVMIGLVLIVLLPAATMAYIGWGTADPTVESRHQVEQLERQIADLEDQVQASSLQQTYDALAAQIELLKASRTEWVPLMEAIDTYLPASALILSLEARDTDRLYVVCEFQHVEDVAVYVAHLSQSAHMEQVEATTVQQQVRTVTRSHEAGMIEAIEVPYYTAQIQIEIGNGEEEADHETT